MSEWAFGHPHALRGVVAKVPCAESWPSLRSTAPCFTLSLHHIILYLDDKWHSCQLQELGCHRVPGERLQSLLLPRYIRNLLPNSCLCTHRPLRNVTVTSWNSKKHPATGLQSQPHRGNGSGLGTTVKPRLFIGPHTHTTGGHCSDTEFLFPSIKTSPVSPSACSIQPMGRYDMCVCILTALFLLSISSKSPRKHPTGVDRGRSGLLWKVTFYPSSPGHSPSGCLCT